jgi:hypothetical protein
MLFFRGGADAAFSGFHASATGGAAAARRHRRDA